MRKSAWPSLCCCWKSNTVPSAMTLGAKSARATRPPCTAISTVRSNNVELASLADGRLQAIGQRDGQRRDLRRLDDPDRLVAFEPDREVQPGQGDELGLGRGVEL